MTNLNDCEDADSSETYSILGRLELCWEGIENRISRAEITTPQRDYSLGDLGVEIFRTESEDLTQVCKNTHMFLAFSRTGGMIAT